MILGDIGVELNFTIRSGGNVLDLTDSTVDLIIKSSTNRQERPCAITDIKGGKVQYVTVASDFPSAGTYKLALQVTYAPDSIFNTSPISLNVTANI